MWSKNRKRKFLYGKLVKAVYGTLLGAIIFYQKLSKHLIKQIDKPICIIVGPEGDFSEKERKEILSFEGVNKIKINENILRSETAAISALSIVNYAYNL